MARENPTQGDALAKFRCGFAQLIDALAADGKCELSRELAQVAVKHHIWNHPLQRPHQHFVSAIPATPLIDLSEFWFVPYLEQNFAAILAEVESVRDPQDHGFTPVDGPGGPVLYKGGKWEHAILYHDGVRMEETCRLFPVTSALLERIPEVTTESWGLAYVSWLHPGTHITSHCGPSNGRLRLHFGIKVPSNVKMRVGDQEFTWQPGKCVVIDDSFEHEVWHRGHEPRIVLILDFLHPQLDEKERARIMSSLRSSEHDKILEYLIDKQIEQLKLDANGEVIAYPTAPVVAMIRSKMRQLGLCSVRNKNGKLVAD